MTLQNTLKNTINIILACKYRLVKRIFNHKCEENNDSSIIKKLENQISHLNLFYNIFIDNLYEDIKKEDNLQDLEYFNKLYDNLFTVNTISNMKISSMAMSDLDYLSYLSDKSQTVILNYCSIFTSTNALIIPSQNYFVTCTFKLLFSVFCVWSEYYDLFIDDISCLNELIKQYNITFVNDMEFINLFYKLIIKIKDSIDQQKIIKLLEEFNNKYQSFTFN